MVVRKRNKSEHRIPEQFAIRTKHELLPSGGFQKFESAGKCILSISSWLFMYRYTAFLKYRTNRPLICCRL